MFRRWCSFVSFFPWADVRYHLHANSLKANLVPTPKLLKTKRQQDSPPIMNGEMR
jgi:hypothetical protein